MCLSGYPYSFKSITIEKIEICIVSLHGMVNVQSYTLVSTYVSISHSGEK